MKTNTFERIIMRIAVYRVENGELFPLHHAPIYFQVPQNDRSAYYSVDVMEDSIVLEPGEIAVEIGIVDRSGGAEARLLIPAITGNGHLRKLLDNRLELVQVTPGIGLYGRVLPD